MCLRIARRTLVLRGFPDHDILPALDEVLVSERPDNRFCTACDLTISSDRAQITSRLAGHPPPILLDGRPELLSNTHRGLPLGIRSDRAWESATVDVTAPWGILAYTDGAFEATQDDGSRLEIAGLVELVRSLPSAVDQIGLDALLDAIERPHQQSRHADDLALIGLLAP